MLLTQGSHIRDVLYRSLRQSFGCRRLRAPPLQLSALRGAKERHFGRSYRRPRNEASSAAASHGQRDQRGGRYYLRLTTRLRGLSRSDGNCAATNATAAVAATVGGTPAQPLPDSLREDAIQAALLATSFRQAVLDIAGIDDSTADGRRAVIDAAFSSGSIIIVRLLAYGSASLAKRHPLLAKLLNLRSELPSYFSYCQVVQADGTLTALAQRWSWVDRTGADDTQLRLFLRQQYSKMNWIEIKLIAD